MKDYTYICNICGRVLEKDTHPWGEDGAEPYDFHCCDEGMERVFNSEFVNISMGEHERYSTSMGCLPSEVERMTKAYPGSEYVMKDGMAQLKIKSRTHKKYEMKRRGYSELD